MISLLVISFLLIIPVYYVMMKKAGYLISSRKSLVMKKYLK